MPTITEQLVSLHCVRCGVSFGVPLKLLTFRQRDCKHLHCPNGHHNWWPGGVSYEDLEERNEERKRRIHELKCRIARRTHDLDQAEARCDDDRPVVIQQSPLPAPKARAYPPVKPSLRLVREPEDEKRAPKRKAVQCER